MYCIYGMACFMFMFLCTMYNIQCEFSVSNQEWQLAMMDREMKH